MASAKERRALKCVLLLQVFGLISAQRGFITPGFRASITRDTQGSRASISRDTQGSRASISRDTQGSRASISRDTQGSRASISRDEQGFRGSSTRDAQGSRGSSTRDAQGFRDSNTRDAQGFRTYNTRDAQGFRDSNTRDATEVCDPQGFRSSRSDRCRSRDTPLPVNCLPTMTTVRGGKACGGQTIFEDDFNTLREDVWQIEQFIPVSSHPEYPFVSYQRLSSDPVVSVSNGYLHIAPKIQQKMSGFTNESIYLGTLDLFNGCTSRAEECYRQASGPDILPPVVSGRLTSSGFAFKYGTVHVKAKLPQGDWLYPEILLEPFLKKYGSSNYASGVLKIAAARGNSELRVGSEEYGNKILYGGPIMDGQCREQLMSKNVLDGGRWGDHFHEYSITWTPQYIALSVDGEEWARVEAMGGLRSRFPETCAHLPRMLLEKGSRMAPFDDFFYLTLGVAAGGITEFPDNSYSGPNLPQVQNDPYPIDIRMWQQENFATQPKPWRNSARKGMLAFWENLSVWENTWTQPEMLVDSVRVIAL